MKKVVWFVVIWQIVALIIIGAILWWLWRHPVVQNSLAKRNLVNTTSNSQTYTNVKMGFSFELPKNYNAVESYNSEGVFSALIKIVSKTENDRVMYDSENSITVYESKMTMDDLKRLARMNEEVVISTQNIKIDNTTAVKYELGGMNTGEKILALNDKYAVIIAAANSNIIIDSSTFKFPR